MVYLVPLAILATALGLSPVKALVPARQRDCDEGRHYKHNAK